jgi:hypothetical protein
MLERQSVSFPEETLVFTLKSASEAQSNSVGYDQVIISVNEKGDVNLMNADSKDVFSYGNYKIAFESADGDKDKIMGAVFSVIKI